MVTEGPYKPHFNRSDPRIVLYSTVKDSRVIGDISNYRKEWRKASSKTLAELAVLGKLSLGQLKHILSESAVTIQQFRRAFWKEIGVGQYKQHQILAVNRFAPIVF